MAQCDVQALLTDGKEFGALPPGDQMTAELALLARWAGYTGTVEQLLEDGKCFGQVCTQAGDQMTAQLQLLCQIASAGPDPLVVSTIETDASVTDGVPQSDGIVTIVVSGGTGPYTVHSANGYPDQTGAGPNFIFSGLPGSATYSFWVEDSGGQVYPVDYPISTVGVYVYTQSFSWNYSVFGARGNTNYPVGNVSATPVTAMAKFDPINTGYIDANLDSVDFSLDFGTLKNNYGGTVTVWPGSPYSAVVTTSTAVTLTVESVVRVSGNISRPTSTQSNPTPPSPTILIVGPAASSITPPSVNFSDSTTLAACTGVGNLNLLYTSVHPVADQTGSTNCTLSVSSPQYAFQATVTYNYTVPRQ